MTINVLVTNERNANEQRNLTTADTQPLGRPLVQFSVAATATASASTDVPAGARAVSIDAVGAALRLCITESGTAAVATDAATFPASNATSIYIPSGSTKDFKVFSGQNWSIKRAGSTDGTAEVTFLA